MDKETRRLIALHRGQVRISDTGRKGRKRTEKTTWGFVPGTVLRLEFADGTTMEIDIIATAAPILSNWSAGASVAHLDGPFAGQGTY
jgi:hypothetical protein